MFALVAIAVGAAVGLVIGRVLDRNAQLAPPVVTPQEPNRLTEHQLEELLAPYERAA